MQTLSPETNDQTPSAHSIRRKNSLVGMNHSLCLDLHDEAVKASGQINRAEADMLEILFKVEDIKLYHQFGLTSLFQYCVELLNLTRDRAYNLIEVMKTSVEVPELRQAILDGRTSVSKARKVCSVINPTNAKEWIELATECSARVVEKAVAMANPRAAVRESLKYVSGDTLQLSMGVSEEWASLLEETKDRLSQQKRRNVSTEEAIFILMAEAKRRHDPVEKAKRSKARREKKFSSLDPKEKPGSDSSHAKPNSFPNKRHGARSRYKPANVRHEVNLRDRNQCAHMNSIGDRCPQKRWLDRHHILQFAKGGAHEADNLETLCWSHHQMRHRH